jgi:hypothetical protein
VKRLFISIVMALALLVGLVPAAAAFAAESGGAAGSFSIGGVAPNVSDCQVYSDAGLTMVATALTPQVIYYVKVTVSDANTLNDVKEVKVKLFYDVGAAHPNESTITAGNEQTAGIFTWTKAGNVWAVDAGSGATWAAISGSSVTPTLTASSGDWVFAIKVGKTATESIAPNVWDLHARATDNSDLTTGFYLWGKSVLWYGEIIVNTPNINFGSVVLGSGFAADVNKVTNINSTYISNGDYATQRKSSATWTGSSNTATLDPNGNCVNAGQFALKTWYADSYGSALLMDTVGVTIRTTGTQTLETGHVTAGGTYWLKVASVFPVDVYSGTIYLMLVNR